MTTAIDINAVLDRADHGNKQRAFYKNFRKWAKLVGNVFKNRNSASKFFEALGALGYEGLLAPLDFAVNYAEELHYVIGMAYGTVAIAHKDSMSSVAPPDNMPADVRGAYIRGIGDVRRMHETDSKSLPLKGLAGMDRRMAVNFVFALYSSLYFSEQGGTAWSMPKDISRGRGKLKASPSYPMY